MGANIEERVKEKKGVKEKEEREKGEKER